MHWKERGVCFKLLICFFFTIKQSFFQKNLQVVNFHQPAGDPLPKYLLQQKNPDFCGFHEKFLWVFCFRFGWSLEDACWKNQTKQVQRAGRAATSEVATSGVGVKPPKWMVKIMENPTPKWMIWKYHFYFWNTHFWGMSKVCLSKVFFSDIFLSGALDKRWCMGDGRNF